MREQRQPGQAPRREQLALLSLCLRHRRRYHQLALALGVEEGEARQIAHRLLAELAPAEADRLSPRRRALLADFLLGQQSQGGRLQSYDLLLSDPAARAFARAVSGRLKGVDRALGRRLEALLEGVSEGPLEGSTAATQEPLAGRRPPLRQIGAHLAPPPFKVPRLHLAAPPPRVQGAALLLCLAGAVAGILVGSGVFSEPRPRATATRGAALNHAATSAAATPEVVAQVNLESPHGGGAKGAAEVARIAGHLALALEGEGLPPSGSNTYVVWLYNSPTSFLPVGTTPKVSENGKLPAAGAELPADASSYREVIVTREASAQPTSPGEVLLRGRLNLAGS